MFWHRTTVSQSLNLLLSCGLHGVIGIIWSGLVVREDNGHWRGFWAEHTLSHKHRHVHTTHIKVRNGFFSVKHRCIASPASFDLCVEEKELGVFQKALSFSFSLSNDSHMGCWDTESVEGPSATFSVFSAAPAVCFSVAWGRETLRCWLRICSFLELPNSTIQYSSV